MEYRGKQSQIDNSGENWIGGKNRDRDQSQYGGCHSKQKISRYQGIFSQDASSSTGLRCIVFANKRGCRGGRRRRRIGAIGTRNDDTIPTRSKWFPNRNATPKFYCSHSKGDQSNDKNGNSNLRRHLQNVTVRE